MAIAVNSTLDELGAFVATTEFAHIPPAIRERAAVVLLDTLGVTLGGSVDPGPIALAREVLATESGTTATVLRRGFPRSTALGAAFLNGTAAVTLEMDEGHRYYGTHAASHVLAAALAVAEQEGSSGAELLAALIVGYDVAARIGGAKRARPSVNSHGTWGTVGAAAAAARLLRLPASETTVALALGCHLSLAATMRASFEGATVRNAFSGIAAQNGIRAAQLARAGYSALPDAAAEVFGNVLGEGFDGAAAVQSLGSTFEISRNFLKLYACCHYAHAPLEALEALLAAAPVAPEALQEIAIRTYSPATKLAAAAPVNTFQAKFSLPFALAARVVLGHARADAFTPAVLADVRVRRLAARVRLIEDPAMTAGFPVERAAEVCLRFVDGTERRAVCMNARGDFLSPHANSAIFDKFDELAGRVLPPASLERVRALVLGIESTDDIRSGFSQALRAFSECDEQED